MTSPFPIRTSDATIIDSPSGIRFMRLLALRGALRLEIQGLKRRGPSAFSIIKREFGLRGNRESVLTQFCEYIEQQRSLL